MTGSRRREMNEVRDRVMDGDLDGIVAQLRSMKRPWDVRGLAGWHKRRDVEADRVSTVRRRYSDDELTYL